MIASYGFILPPFAWWTPDEFRTRVAGTRIAREPAGR
jgi:hypothetical protein